MRSGEQAFGAALFEPGAVDPAERIRRLLRDFSIESTPRQCAAIEAPGTLLPESCRVFLTFLPGETVDAALSAVRRLIGDGLRPVPHVCARNLMSQATLQHYLRGARVVGVTEALVIAGSARRPAGPYADTMDLLETGLFEELGYRRIYVAGHPEGSPDIPEEVARRALFEKQQWSRRTGIPMEIVTQFGFDAGKLLGWLRRIRKEGIELPVRIGVPGPASVGSLMKYASLCGVSASAGFLRRSAGRLYRLAGQAAPDGYLTEIARAMDPTLGIAGVHFYPFGGFARTARWARAVAEGHFTLLPGGKGFSVAA